MSGAKSISSGILLMVKSEGAIGSKEAMTKIVCSAIDGTPSRGRYAFKNNRTNKEGTLPVHHPVSAVL